MKIKMITITGSFICLNSNVVECCPSKVTRDISAKIAVVYGLTWFSRDFENARGRKTNKRILCILLLWTFSMNCYINEFYYVHLKFFYRFLCLNIERDFLLHNIFMITSNLFLMMEVTRWECSITTLSGIISILCNRLLTQIQYKTRNE